MPLAAAEVEKAECGSNGGLAVTERIPGQTDPRR
jgi:hypothetical protein